jgi:hypothetical protein
MSPTAICFAGGLRLTLITVLFAGSMSAACVCENTAAISFQNILSSDRLYALPRISVAPTRQFSDLPTVLQITTDVLGKVCSVQALKMPEPDLVPTIEKVVRNWTFSPKSFNKSGVRTPTCVRSKLFIYATRRGSTLTWDVPGLTDRTPAGGTTGNK